jgi:hypothetical protein
VYTHSCVYTQCTLYSHCTHGCTSRIRLQKVAIVPLSTKNMYKRVQHLCTTYLCTIRENEIGGVIGGTPRRHENAIGGTVREGSLRRHENAIVGTPREGTLRRHFLGKYHGSWPLVIFKMSFLQSCSISVKRVTPEESSKLKSDKIY